MNGTAKENQEIKRRWSAHRPRSQQESKNKHHTHTGKHTGHSRETSAASSNLRSSQRVESPSATNTHSEPQKPRSSGKFHFHRNRLSAVETSETYSFSQPPPPSFVQDENTIISNVSDQPGAFREGGDIQDEETNTTNLEERTEAAPEPLIDQEGPLKAEVVEQHDLQKEVQKRIQERTVDATSVKIAESAKRTTSSDSILSKSASLVLLVVGVLLLGSGVAIALGTILPSKKSDNGSNSHMASPPPTILTDEPTPMPTLFISEFDTAKDLLVPISGYVALSDVSTPQYKALWWLIHDDPVNLSISNDDGIIDSIFLERYVMALFYFATDGPNWVLSLDFLSNMSVCDWPVGGSDGISNNGVKCNPEGSMVGIKFEDNNLNGTLPSELSVLSSLEFISIVGNGLHGTIPPSLGELRRLQKLKLARGQLTGPIPESFIELRKLEILWLDDNELTGTIPLGLIEISSLELFGIEYNFITGTIPEVSSSLESLQELWIGWNLMSGPVPQYVYFPKLQFLSIYANQFTGTLSDNLGDLKDLTFLDTNWNYLTGVIPTEIGLLGNLEYLDLSSNGFSGTLPSELGLLTGVYSNMLFHNNQLSGTVPMELSTLSPEVLTIFANNLTGSLDMFCNKTSLTTWLAADCGGVNPQINCPCCTLCCSSSMEDCTVNLPALCQFEKSLFEDPNGSYYYESAGTVCECIFSSDDNNLTLSCTDTQCQSCNRDGTVCSKNENFSIEYSSYGLWEKTNSTFQYVVGRNDTVSLVGYYSLTGYDAPYEITINGEICNRYDFTECADGFMGYDVYCENVDGAGFVNICDEKRPDYDDGPLAVFTLQDPAFLSGCPPRFLFVE